MTRPGNDSIPGKCGTFGTEKCPVATTTQSNVSVLSLWSGKCSTVTENLPEALSYATWRTAVLN